MSGHFWIRIWSQLFAELSAQELGWLVSPVGHISLLARRRAAMIGSRILFIASLFAIITPLWIIVDMLTLPWPVWLGIAVGRMFATLGFMALVIAYDRPESMAAGAPLPRGPDRDPDRVLHLQLLLPAPLRPHRPAGGDGVRLQLPALRAGGRTGDLSADAGGERGLRRRGLPRAGAGGDRALARDESAVVRGGVLAARHHRHRGHVGGTVPARIHDRPGARRHPRPPHRRLLAPFRAKNCSSCSSPSRCAPTRRCRWRSSTWTASRR
ncbi:MAG: hypothetical protein MZW92_78870 [Comamonadaceae bacterium]|nr:hypothetical protein [Comamonadaceae bacterium]